MSTHIIIDRRMKLSFHGGVQEVTGSCCLLQTEKTHALIDCGMFQGADDYSNANTADFAFAPSEVKALYKIADAQIPSAS